MNDGMRLPFENERSWPVQPLWTVFAPIARLADTSLPVLSVSIHSGISDKELSNEERERNVWLSEDRSKYQKVVPGDLVYNSMRAWQGGFGACQTLGLVSPAYGVLSPISTINTKFYELLFRTKGYIALFDTFSPGIIDFRKRLSWDRCKHMKVPVPPLEEQNRIVKFACNVEAKVHLVTQKLQQQLDLLNEYRQSLITRAVTKGLDPNVEMKDSGVEWIGQTPKTWILGKLKYFINVDHGSDPISPGDIPVYGSGASSFKTCGEYKEGPTVLLGRKGTLHIPHYIEGKYWNVDTAFDTHVANPKTMNLLFFYYLANCFDYKSAMNQTTLPGMTQTAYENITLPIPPIDTQKEIVDFLNKKLDSIEIISSKIKFLLESLCEYRSSLISAAVTGQLAIEEAEE